MKIRTLPFGYPHKVNLIFSGQCLQTIRDGTQLQKGEILRLVSWSGVPYQSPPNNSFYTKITDVQTIQVSKAGLFMPEFVPWRSVEAYRLAKADGIENPNGKELKKVLSKFYRITKIAKPYQIIKWEFNKKFDEMQQKAHEEESIYNVLQQSIR